MGLPCGTCGACFSRENRGDSMQTATLNFVMAELFKPASSHRSPKVYQASITWMARTMAEFGKASVDSKAAVAFAKDMLCHKDAAVREAGTEFTAVLHQQMGARLDGMLSADIKSAMRDKVRDRWNAGPAVTGEKQRTEKSRVAAAAKTASSAPSSSNGSVSARTTAASVPGARGAAPAPLIMYHCAALCAVAVRYRFAPVGDSCAVCLPTIRWQPFEYCIVDHATVCYGCLMDRSEAVVSVQ